MCINIFNVDLAMKNNSKFLILVVLILSSGLAKSQVNKVGVDLVIGASVPELYHFGARIHYLPNARLDFNLGSDFKNDENGRIYSATLNHAIYFGKVNPRTDTKLWSFNSGFTFLVEKSIHEKSTAAYLNLFFAREFRISKKIYIQPELGASYFLFEHIVNEDNMVLTGSRTVLIPKFGLNLIMKI
jgi:hypothetical protein